MRPPEPLYHLRGLVNTDSDGFKRARNAPPPQARSHFIIEAADENGRDVLGTRPEIVPLPARAS